MTGACSEGTATQLLESHLRDRINVSKVRTNLVACRKRLLVRGGEVLGVGEGGEGEGGGEGVLSERRQASNTVFDK